MGWLLVVLWLVVNSPKVVRSREPKVWWSIIAGSIPNNSQLVLIESYKPAFAESTLQSSREDDVQLLLSSKVSIHWCVGGILYRNHPCTVTCSKSSEYLCVVVVFLPTMHYVFMQWHKHGQCTLTYANITTEGRQDPSCKLALPIYG